jgi:hypothetical protein
MQKISARKMNHQEAKEYRDRAQDAVMYQHRNGAIYRVPAPDEIEHEGIKDEAQYVTDDPNELLIG